MRIKVLGCHGSDCLMSEADHMRRCQSCGFLVNGSLMVDAGTVASALTLEEQKRIRYVLLSHTHMDHIKDLPMLADNLAGEIDEPIIVAGIPAVLDALKAHVFNGEVYPNFFTLPSAHQPVLKALPLQVGKETRLGGVSVTPILVNHSVPATGFILRDSVGSWVYSGDTHETWEIWEVAAQDPELKAVMIEASFPDELADLALVSKHLTPTLLARQFQKIGRPDLPVYAYHLKPPFRERIVKQLNGLGIENLTILEEGQEIIIESSRFSPEWTPLTDPLPLCTSMT